MDEVVRRYGFTPKQPGNYICCPFHNEKTPSLKVYSQPGRGWMCFGCGKGGTVIDFVMNLYKIPFSAAVVRLNADFNLGLCGKLTPQERREAARQAREVAEEHERQKWATAYSHEQYARLQHYYAWLRGQKQTAAILFDTDYIGRLLDMYLDRDSQITWDATARVEALISKHDNADTFKWAWTDGQAWPPPYFFHPDCELIY